MARNNRNTNKGVVKMEQTQPVQDEVVQTQDPVEAVVKTVEEEVVVEQPTTEAVQEEPVVEEAADAPTEASFTPETINAESVETQVEEPEVKVDTPEVTETVTQASAPSLASILAESSNTVKLPMEVSDALTGLIHNISSNPSASILVHGLFDYVMAMKPGKPMDAKKGAGNQIKLFRLIKLAIEGDCGDFQTVFATVLKFFDEFKDAAFNGRYVYRFTDTMALSSTDVKSFNSLINLLTTAGPVVGRQEAVRQINFEKTLVGINEEGQRKVMSFFGK